MILSLTCTSATFFSSVFFARVLVRCVNPYTRPCVPQFVRPLYRELARSTVGRDAALATFAEFRSMYHPIAAKMVAQVLNFLTACSCAHINELDVYKY